MNESVCEEDNLTESNQILPRMVEFPWAWDDYLQSDVRLQANQSSKHCKDALYAPYQSHNLKLCNGDQIYQRCGICLRLELSSRKLFHKISEMFISFIALAKEFLKLEEGRKWWNYIDKSQRN